MAKAKAQTQDTEPAQFQRGAALVVPSLSIADMSEGDSLFVEFVSEPRTKAQTTSKGEPKLDPETGEALTITTAQVVDLTTGAIGDLVLGYMVCKGLAGQGELHGKRFEFVKGKKKGRTVMWEVYSLV